MTRQIPYEAAFEDFLRSRGLPYVGVNDAQRAIFSGQKVKSFDFVVYAPSRLNWLVDVKGRQFPYNGSGSPRYWENWVGAEDLDTLKMWEEAVGSGFRAMFVFAYALQCDESRWPTGNVHTYRDLSYAFMGIPLGDYREHATERSEKWQTVNVPRKRFRELVRPVQEWFEVP